jgi:hypothetical protein
MKPSPVLGALLPTLFFFSTSALAQVGAPAGPVAFAPVTGGPLLSASGRFSSLTPPNQLGCGHDKIAGRVVSPSLIMVKQIDCGRHGHDNVLVNVQFANPSDAAQMVTGRQVAITARLKSAEEDRDPLFYAEYIIADQARLVSGDPREPSAPPAPAFTSYMMCQPPELDTLATTLGKELCVQSTVVADLAQTSPALERAAHMPADVPPTDAVPGDPSAISCRLDPKRSDAQLPAIACARNSYWAWYSEKWPAPWSSAPAPP